MVYTADDIARVLQLPNPAHPDYTVEWLLTDSRCLSYPATTLFFAITTASNDGHRYVSELYRQGVRNFVVTDRSLGEVYPDANFFVVDNSLQALQRVASHHRNRFDIPVIAITGSRGKTVVKEMLYQILSPDYRIARSPRSYNSQIGVPLSLWEIGDDCDLAIIEAGISLPGEMPRLEAMISPTIGVLTTIGQEHSEGFSSLADKAAEKVTLFRNCDCIVYNGDDSLIAKAVSDSCLTAKEIAWSHSDPDTPLYIISTHTEGDATAIKYSWLGVDFETVVPMTAPYEVRDAINVLAVALYLHVSPEEIAKRMLTMHSVATRLEVADGVNSCLVIHDKFTPDLHSLMPALYFMARQSAMDLSTTVILSDITHESLSADEIYKRVAQLLDRRRVGRVIGVGEEISRHAGAFASSSRFFRSVEEFMGAMSADDFADEMILIKGDAREFDRIAQMLEAKRHETVLEVNLDSIVNNFNTFRARLRPTTGIVAMVKASGYGAGVVEIAKTLQAQGAAYLAVAVLDEGVELRRAGVVMPIMVLNPKVDDYQALFANRLEPEIYSFDILDEIVREASRRGITDYPIHIKLDTGMHRLGFVETDIPRLATILLAQNAVSPRSVFSHLATADCLDMDDYTHEQLETFHRASQLLQSAFPGKILRHILNSAGIIRFPEHQCEMVRLGLCLYGLPVVDLTDVDTSELSAKQVKAITEVNESLRPVSALRTTIISIKEWPSGTTIGYSRRGVLHRPSVIATLPIGYADGLNRHLGNGRASFVVDGHRCPTVGNICMDLCMIDITDVPTATVGTSVEIFGQQMPVTELAAALDTISYEVLTSVSTRVKRIYYRE